MIGLSLPQPSSGLGHNNTRMPRFQLEASQATVGTRQDHGTGEGTAGSVGESLPLRSRLLLLGATGGYWGPKPGQLGHRTDAQGQAEPGRSGCSSTGLIAGRREHFATSPHEAGTGAAFVQQLSQRLAL